MITVRSALRVRFALSFGELAGSLAVYSLACNSLSSRPACACLRRAARRLVITFLIVSLRNLSLLLHWAGESGTLLATRLLVTDICSAS